MTAGWGGEGKGRDPKDKNYVKLGYYIFTKSKNQKMYQREMGFIIRGGEEHIDIIGSSAGRYRMTRKFRQRRREKLLWIVRGYPTGGQG